MTEDEMVGWHHRLNGLEFEQVSELVMDREAWRAAVGVAKSWTRLRHFTELRHDPALISSSPCAPGYRLLTVFP